MTDIQKHMMRSFITLRISVGLIGLAFPFILAYGGIHEGVPFAGSMSSYYHATSACWIPDKDMNQTNGHIAWPSEKENPCLPPGAGVMRNWFVSILCFIGAAMFAIKGFSIFEDWLLNIAAVMAPMVAFNPMAWPPDGKISRHYVFAVTFFICIGLSCVFCSFKTLTQMPKNIKNRQRVMKMFGTAYVVLAVCMIGAPLSTMILTRGKPHGTFCLEAAGVLAFGFYWLVKTGELWFSNVENDALAGTLQMDPKKLL